MIKIQDFTLDYSSLAFSDRSIKTAFIQKVRGAQKVENIRALSNISIQISDGERVAIIGHNGAGKSSLLKAIAGIYPPTYGSILSNGRIRSLLELHLGFEIDATGRENIRYRGLLLGAHPREIPALEMDVENFCQLGIKLDLPIRTYSSGMLVRLAFGIASYFPGEILLLDEVISAGDLEFFSKMQERLLTLVDSANILVLATHDLESARNFCTRALVLRNGSLIYDGSTDDAIAFYKRVSSNE
jgi:lipopolysaccharide transport system ATP-binding protein